MPNSNISRLYLLLLAYRLDVFVYITDSYHKISELTIDLYTCTARLLIKDGLKSACQVFRSY